MRLNAVLVRGVFGLSLVMAVTLTWAQLVQQTRWQGYTALARDVAQGRSAAEDMARLEPLLARDGHEPCAVLRGGTPVTLHLYASDLLAQAAGTNPFLPADDPRLTAQRQAARAVLEQAVACAPMDGNLWLSLAVLARALDEDPAQTVRYLAFSERYAPHEGWISDRRAQLF